jgi:DNA-binding CsgD family transcriptional regulator
LSSSHPRGDALPLAFHDAALEPQLWPAVLEQAAAQLGAAAALLVARFVPPQPRPLLARFHGIAPEAAVAYTTTFYQDDPVLPGASRLAPGSVFRLRDFFTSEREMAAAPVVRDWLRPQGFGDLMGVVIAPGTPYGNMLLAFTTPERPFAAHAEALLHAWGPHLQRAVRTLRRLETGTSERALLRDVVDRLGAGLIAVGQSGRVLLTNRRADRILAARDGLLVREGCLHASSAADRERLWAVLRQSMKDRVEACAALTRPSGAVPLTILSVPLDTPDKLGSDELELAILFIHDPLASPSLEPSDLRVMFGLTPGQAELAALLSQGHSLEEVSERLGLTLNTVRTRVKQVFERTGTSRQAELVRRLVLSAAGLRRRPTPG